MSRVFAKPTYVERLGDGNPARASIAHAVAKESSRFITAAMVANDDITYTDVLDLIDDGETGSIHSSIVSTVAHTSASYLRLEVVNGARAVDIIFRHVLASESIRDPSSEWGKVAQAARAAAAVGCVAGWASPGPSVSEIESVKLDSVHAWRGTKAVDLIALSDEIRLGFACPCAKEAYMTARKESVRADWRPDMRKLSVDETRGAKILGARSVHAVGKTLVISLGRTVAVVDTAHRANLASCIYSAAMWAMSAQGHELAAKAIEYVRTSLAAVPDARCCELAKYLKSEYAVILCGAQTDAEPSLIQSQYDGLGAECATSVFWGKVRRFSAVMGSTDDAINFGTVWNILPPDDIDPAVLSSAFRKKCSSEKAADDEAWDDFVDYSAMVASAHYILAHRESEVVFHKAGADVPEWAARCRAGILTYAKKGTYDWISASIPWVRLMENWAYGAQDVTHVYSDDCASVDNELTYALEHGPLLSKTWAPSEIRAAWSSGSLPGSRNLYMAGKSENTKFDEKVRETMSADDVMRECLSEIDRNMTTIGHVVHGVTMRRGRSSVEHMINKVLSHGTAGRTLLSLDVSGWSPNMIRRKQMMFVDRLMSMYDIPASMKASTVFRDLRVHVRRGNFSDTFDMIDGSVQGFFGTADTIMHSMIAQWAFRNGREEGVFADRAKIDKVVLIDDILCCLDGIGAGIHDAVDYFTAQYARLGFAVDTVKTLAAPNIGTFLNRVYTPRGEIATWAKIAAKSDREWDRPVVGIQDEVSSVFGGFAGAVDRGMPIVRAYTLACFRAISRVCTLMGKGWVPSEGLFHISTLCPAAWGGLGIPSVTEWITGGAAGAAPSRLAALASVARQVKSGGYGRADSIARGIYALADSPVHVRSPHAAFSNPTAVRPASVKTAGGGIVAAIRSAIRTKFPSSMFGRFYSLVPGEDVDSACSLAMSEGVFDAPVCEALWACTPYAVAESALSRFASSAEGLRWIKRKNLVEILRRTRQSDKANLRMHADAGESVTAHTTIDGSAIILDMINREGVCHGLRNVISPAPADILGYAPSSITSHVSAYIKASSNVYGRASDTPHTRTFTSATARIALPALDLAGNPILTAFGALIKAASVAESVNGCGSAAYAFVLSMWGVVAQSPMYYPIPSDNPFRVLSCYCAPSHSVRAVPNYAGSVKVSYNSGLRDFQLVNKNFDWATIKAFIMGACVVDASLGLASQINGQLKRDYVVRNTAQITRMTSNPIRINSDALATRSAVALDQSFFDNFAMLLVQAGAQIEDADRDQDIGPAAAAISSGNIVDQRATSRPLDFGSLMASIRSATDAPSASTDATTVEVPPSAAAPRHGASPIVLDWCALFRSMAPAAFSRRVADSGADLGAELCKTSTGAAMWKSIASRNVDKCTSAMRVLSSVADHVGSPSSMRAWREECSIRYAGRSEDMSRSAEDRYYYHFLGGASRELARSNPNNSGSAYAVACYGLTKARNALGRRSGIEDAICDTMGDYAEDRKSNLMTSIDMGLDFVAVHDVRAALSRAWDTAYSWVISDYVAPEVQTARVATAAAGAVAGAGDAPARAAAWAHLDDVFSAGPVYTGEDADVIVDATIQQAYAGDGDNDVHM